MSKSVGNPASPPLSGSEPASIGEAVEHGSVELSAAADAAKERGGASITMRPKLYLGYKSK